MPKQSLVTAVVAVALVAFGAWWYFGAHAPAPRVGGPAVFNIGSSPAVGLTATEVLGPYLLAYNGMTLYTFANDSEGTTTCYAQCAAEWPPYLVPVGTQLHASSNITGQLGTLVRTDRTLQVTYNGLPLYLYAGDHAAGDTTGQGMGGAWFVAKP